MDFAAILAAVAALITAFLGMGSKSMVEKLKTLIEIRDKIPNDDPMASDLDETIRNVSNKVNERHKPDWIFNKVDLSWVIVISLVMLTIGITLLNPPTPGEFLSYVGGTLIILSAATFIMAIIVAIVIFIRKFKKK